MKYLKQLLLSFVIGLFIIVLYVGITQGLYYLFLFPLLFLFMFLGFYLQKQFNQDNTEKIEKGVQYAIEDIEAEKWVKNDFTPNLLSKIKAKQWQIILYSFLLIAGGSFAWSYISFGIEIAVRNFLYGTFLFWLFIVYTITVLTLTARFEEYSRKKMKPELIKYFGDWERAYFFLLPISFTLYLLFPIDTFEKDIIQKIHTFPVFFLIYTFLYLALYACTYIYEDMQNDEQKRLEKEMKKILEEEKE